MNFHNQKGFIALLSLLAALVLVSVLVVVMMKRPVADRETTKVLKQEGIDTSSQMAIVNSFTEKLKAVEQMQLDSEEKLFQDLQ